MAFQFNDDEPILAPPGDPGPKPAPLIAGRTQVRIFQNPEAPLEETKFKVLLELTGAGSASDRSGVDIVAVLDVSGSMGKKGKLDKLKLAMKFLIRKLSSIDRLSVVTFENAARRKCPLRQMTEAAQSDIEAVLDGLVAGRGTNIAGGLQTGLDVLNQRTVSTGRTGAVMLMSDGEQTSGDATKVPIGDIPVCTFGFGASYDATVLNAIAKNSKGGVFSTADVENTTSSNLSIAFSQCLGGLLTVAVQDLQLVIMQQPQSTMDKVTAGSYPITADKAAVTVSFGDLYSKEVRRVLVELTLPALSTRTPRSEILRLVTKYSNGGVVFDESPRVVVVKRVGTPTAKKEEEVVVEEARLKTVKMMKTARDMADKNLLDDAKDKIVEAENMLEDVELEEPNSILDMMKSELQQLIKLMDSLETYKTKGRAFALSSETSHERQRHATRGNAEKNRMYATPRMDAYLEQAKAFDEDPTQPLPSAEDYEKKEAAADPLAAISGPTNYYLEMAIGALRAIRSTHLLDHRLALLVGVLIYFFSILNCVM